MLPLDKINILENVLENGLKIPEYCGKERGHSMASWVESEVFTLLECDFNVVVPEEVRAFADGFVDGNTFNVKFGTDKTNGQPNMCSLVRLIKHLKSGEVDSYYIISVEEGSNSLEVCVFDLLANLDFVHFDAGTGQLMLKKSTFYKNLDNINKINTDDISKTIDKLEEIYTDGIFRLIDNRLKSTMKLCSEGHVENIYTRLVEKYEHIGSKTR